MFSQKWTAEEIQKATRNKTTSSTYLEMLAAFKGLTRYIERNLLILLETDNDNIVEILRKGWSRDPETNKLVAQTLILLAKHNCMLRVRHVDREENDSADALSKNDTKRLLTALRKDFNDNIADQFIANSLN
jgi:ribonuclease HI